MNAYPKGIRILSRATRSKRVYTKPGNDYVDFWPRICVESKQYYLGPIAHQIHVVLLCRDGERGVCSGMVFFVVDNPVRNTALTKPSLAWRGQAARRPVYYYLSVLSVVVRSRGNRIHISFATTTTNAPPAPRLTPASASITKHAS